MERNVRKTFVGTVSSNKMDKTVVLRVQRLVKHSLYEKFIRRHTRLHAHDERNECGIGDRVEVVESRPLSKTKRWRLVKVIDKAVDDSGLGGAPIETGAKSQKG